MSLSDESLKISDDFGPTVSGGDQDSAHPETAAALSKAKARCPPHAVTARYFRRPTPKLRPTVACRGGARRFHPPDTNPRRCLATSTRRDARPQIILSSDFHLPSDEPRPCSTLRLIHDLFSTSSPQPATQKGRSGGAQLRQTNCQRQDMTNHLSTTED